MTAQEAVRYRGRRHGTVRGAAVPQESLKVQQEMVRYLRRVLRYRRIRLNTFGRGAVPYRRISLTVP